VNKRQETAVTASAESFQLVADMLLSVRLHAQELHAKTMPTRLYADSVPGSGLSSPALLCEAMCIAVTAVGCDKPVCSLEENCLPSMLVCAIKAAKLTLAVTFLIVFVQACILPGTFGFGLRSRSQHRSVLATRQQGNLGIQGLYYN
jgi:hypothetical protein